MSGDRIEPREQIERDIFNRLRERQDGLDALADALRASKDAQSVLSRLNAYGYEIRRSTRH